MHHRQIDTLISQVFTTAERLGATVPKRLVAEREKIKHLADSVRFLDAPSDVSGAVLAALAAGKDPATDQGVRNAVIGREVNATANGIADRLGQRGETFLRENADELLGMFAKPFDAAVAALSDAAERLGDLDLDDTRAVIAKGGDAAATWASAQDAEKAIASIQTVWKQVATLVPGMSSPDSRYRMLVIADIEPGAYLEQELNTAAAHLRPFELARRGHRLSLATPTVLTQRIAALQDEIQRRARSAPTFQDQYRRVAGSGVA